MNYELGKELEKAGFVFSGCCEVDSPHHSDCLGSCHNLLSELIEACGEEFYRLEKKKSLLIGWTWVAHKRDYFSIPVIGKTPEEAVARLWLALNK